MSLQSVHAGVEGAVVSMEASQDLLSPIADRWTLPKFGTPMAADDLGRRIAEDGTDARTDGKKSTPSRKVTSRPARQA